MEDFDFFEENNISLHEQQYEYFKNGSNYFRSKLISTMSNKLKSLLETKEKMLMGINFSNENLQEVKIEVKVYKNLIKYLIKKFML